MDSITTSLLGKELTITSLGDFFLITPKDLPQISGLGRDINEALEDLTIVLIRSHKVLFSISGDTLEEVYPGDENDPEKIEKIRAMHWFGFPHVDPIELGFYYG